VPSAERRVLELRAGVGGKHTRSRADVARLTGLHRKSVTRLERRGLKRLQTLAGAGTCAGATSGSAAGAPIADLGSATQGATQGANAGGAPGTGVPGAHVKHQSAESKSSDDHQSAFQAAIERPIIRGMGHTLDLGPLLLAFALGGMLYLVARELKRST
jgi:hypothetical protein